MPVFNNALAGAAGSGGAADYKIERSLRFNQADGAYLNKSIGGSATTFTVSCWIKLGGLSSLQAIFGFGSATYSDTLFYNQDNKFSLYNGSSTGHTYSTAVFRDPSAWYHVVVKVSNGSPTLYVNNVETITTSGYNWELNGTYCNIGAFNGAGTPQYSFSGYMADFHCVEGQALDPSSFAETDADTGVWNPIKYSGTYGTNGFHLDFSDNSSDAALGTDSSGNNNTWTVNNLNATGTGVGTSGWPNKIGGAQSTYDSATTTSTVSSGTSWSTNGNNNTLHFDTQALGTHTITFTKTGGSNNIDFESSSSSNSGYSRVTNSSSTITISSTGSSQTHSYNRYVRFSGSGSGNVTFSISGTAQGADSVGIDSLIDSPSNYEASSGNNGGNYSTWNPLVVTTNNSLSNGNLEASHTASTGWTGNPGASGYAMFVGNMGVTSGKYYWEGSFTSGTVGAVGVVNKPQGHLYYVGYADTTAKSAGYSTTYVYNNGFGSAVGSLPAITQGDIIGVAIDMDNGKLYFSLNGTYINSGDPVAGTGFVASGLNGETIFPAISHLGSNDGYSFTANFGQRPFAYTPPTNYKSLCTTNLPDPLIENPSTAFQTKLWYGTQAARSITTTGMSPDLVWIKGRSHATWHELFDSVRGPEKRVFVNEPDAEATNANTLTAFNSDGFSLLGDAGVNGTSNRTYVGWAWDGGDLVTNSTYNQSQTWSNSLTSSNGFWTGQGATNAFDGTGSSVTGTNNGGTLTFSPNLTIPANSTIQVRPSSHSSGYTVVVNGVSNSITGDSFHTVNYDGSTTLSSITVTSAGSTSGDLKGIKINGKLLVDKGVIPVGSLTSSVYDQTQTWSTYGTFENHYTGSGGAYLWDDVFNTSDVNNGDGSLYVNTTSLDKWTLTSSQAVSSTVKILVQGANAKLTINAGLSDETTVTSTQTNYHYLTASFSGNVSSVSVGPANSSQAIYVMGIWFDDVRLVDDTETVPTLPSIASTVSANPATGVSIVSYTGTGANATIAHGLNAAPEFAIFKARNGSNHWLVYHKSIGNDKKVNLNLSDAQSSSSTSYFQSTDPTSSVFYLGTESSGNWSNYNMIGYLFSSVEGYSAFGTYEGNNNANGPFLYTGFRPAFFLVKNIDASQPWNIYDAARDPDNVVTKGLQPPSPGVEYDTTDRCDFLSNGIKIKSSSGTVPNLSGNTYVYAAFAENPFKTARAR